MKTFIEINIQNAVEDYWEAQESAREMIEMGRSILGERIREARTRKGLSLREVARKVKISAAFLSDIELGRRAPSEENAKKIILLLK